MEGNNCRSRTWFIWNGRAVAGGAAARRAPPDRVHRTRATLRNGERGLGAQWRRACSLGAFLQAPARLGRGRACREDNDRAAPRGTRPAPRSGRQEQCLLGTTCVVAAATLCPFRGAGILASSARADACCARRLWRAAAHPEAQRAPHKFAARAYRAVPRGVPRLQERIKALQRPRCSLQPLSVPPPPPPSPLPSRPSPVPMRPALLITATLVATAGASPARLAPVPAPN